jgi:hypothetical protein
MQGGRKRAPGRRWGTPNRLQIAGRSKTGGRERQVTAGKEQQGWESQLSCSSEAFN